MNFFETIKKDIIDTIHSNPYFKDLAFLNNPEDINPNNWNINRAIGVISIDSLYNDVNETFCDDYIVKQTVTIQYHVKPDYRHGDWESNLNLVQARLIYTIESALKEGTLFSIPQDFDFTFKKGLVAQIKNLKIRDKSFSKCSIIEYELKYDLGKVIDNE